MKMYKVAQQVATGIFAPLFVNAKERWHIGQTVYAHDAERNETGKVKSKLGALMYSPGLHCLPTPSYSIIGHKEQGKIVCMKPKQVWLQVEANMNHDYCMQAVQNARNKKGHIVPWMIHLDHVPEDGYYKRLTNANGEWTICTSSMTIIRVVPQRQVKLICEMTGKQYLPSYNEWLNGAEIVCAER